MFGIRSPKQNNNAEKAEPSTVRRSVGEFEARSKTPPKSQPIPTTSQRLVFEIKGGSKIKATTEASAVSPKQPTSYKSKTAEAKSCLLRAKLQLNNSRNLKSDIKADVLNAIERLYALVKEAEGDRTVTEHAGEKQEEGRKGRNEELQEQQNGVTPPNQMDLSKEFEKQYRMAKETNKKLEEIQKQITEMNKTQQDIHKLTSENKTYTYAEALTGKKLPTLQRTEPCHTIIVTSTEENDSSEDVLDKIRKTVEAKDGEVYVDRIRKAKNKKVVISCNTKENLETITKRIQTNQHLQTEKAKNKDPLVIIRDVLTHNKDEDIVEAIKKQNSHLIKDVPDEDYRVTVKYRRRARNQLENHVILQVSPKIYQRLVTAGAVYIGLQKRTVKDQSPLIQCTKCLGFGHGKKLCTQSESLCSHCAGPHLRSECPMWTVGEQATCRNCSLAKLEKTNHNAFDFECPIKRRWDSIARLSVAYC